MEIQHQYEGFLRQRRNLVLFSVFTLFLVVCGVEFDTVSILGNTVDIEHSDRVFYFIYLIFFYFSWRYYQYQRLVGSPGLNGAREAYVSGRIRGLIEDRGLTQYGKQYDAIRAAWDGSSSPSFGGMLWEQYDCKVVFMINEGRTAQDSNSNQVRRSVMIHRSDVAGLHRKSTMKVAFGTPYFSEYLLPYAIAAASLIGCMVF